MSFWKDLLLKALKAENQVDKVMKRIEIQIKRKLRKLKRKVTGYVFSTVFFVLALGFISVGTALFLSRFIPLDILLLIIGFIFLLIGIFIYLMN